MRFFFLPMFGGVMVLVFLALLGFNIWMLVDAARRPEADFNPPSSRVWWIVGLAVGIFLGWIGLGVSLVYFFLVRKPISEGRPASQLFAHGAGGDPGRTGRTCRNCGEPLGTHARFCQNCGTLADPEDR